MKITAVFLLLLLGVMAPLQAQWGRLFYTPQQRQQLQSGQVLASMPQQHRFDGELITPRGKVQWLDGKIASVPASVKPGTVWRVRK